MNAAVIFLERFGNLQRRSPLCWMQSSSLLPGGIRSRLPAFQRIVAVMATGIAVRGIAPLLKDKWSDPAVVVVAPDLSFAIPVIGGTTVPTRWRNISGAWAIPS